MIRTLILLLAVGLAAPSYASTTWTEDLSKAYAKAVCSTGSESAPTLITEGFNLNGVKGIEVSAETAGTMSSSGTLQAYLWNPISAQWNRAVYLDKSTAAVADQEWGFEVVGMPPGSRIAFIPDSVGVAVTIYIRGGKRR